MASAQSTVAVNLVAGEDLRGALYNILVVNTSGQVVKATVVTETVVGILAEEPRTDAVSTGETVPVAILQGIVKVKAGGVVTAGDLVVPDATTGLVIGVTGVGALAADSMAIGIALVTAADGDIFEMLAMPVAAPHSV